MLAPALAPQGYVNEFRHLLDDNDHYNTLLIHQDERAAQRCVEALEGADEQIGSCFRGSSVEIAKIDGISIRLTANNNLHIKLPGAGRRFAYDYYTGARGAEYRASNGSRVYFDRKFPHTLSQAVVDKVSSILKRQAEVIEREIEDDRCNPPLDLLEDDTVEETPATIDLLR